jgi:RND superfamily putative drug exporter
VLARLGRWSHNRRRIVLAVWVVLLFVFGALSGATGSGFSTAFSLPNVESARGFDIIEQHFGGRGSGNGGTIVFRSTLDGGVQNPQVKEAMTAFLAEVGKMDPLRVTSPYDPQGAQQIGRDGDIAYADVEVPKSFTVEDSAAITGDVQDLAPEIDGLQIEYGGQLFAEFTPPSSETLGLAFAIIILVLAFGSVMAMGLPVVTALFGIGLGVTIVTILSNVFTMPDFTTVLAVMIGLGVGIDYALFIVTRYREGIHAGMSGEDAASQAINTAGRAVLFAGTTVVISLLGMLLMRLQFVNGLSIGAATTVLMTMAASVTLLPALLGFVGDRLEVTRWRGVIATGLVAVALLGMGLNITQFGVLVPVALVVLAVGLFAAPLKKELPKRRAKPLQETLPYRWSHLIQARPWPALIGGVVVLLAVALPFLSLRLGFSDDGNRPEDTTTRKAYDLLANGFGPGFNGPLILATELPKGAADLPAVQKVSEALAGADGVAFASPGFPNDPAKPEAVVWRIIPTSAPQDAATTQLVKHLREEVIPDAASGSDLDIAVTGFQATGVDFSTYLGERLPIFIGVVLVLSFLLLMAVFRSLLVPLKAVVMNLLSIGAAYGLVVMIFQWGWGKQLVGLGKGGPIEPFVPMMMFAIVFGLSMDYEVFLLSRVKEEYDRTGDNRNAVADGLTSTARVITAAAAIMVFVFGSFLLEGDRVIKLMGVGLSSAVLLDATIVRMLLVPATMELLGDRNWWLPHWLDRLLPRIDVEGVQPVAPAVAAGSGGGA